GAFASAESSTLTVLRPDRLWSFTGARKPCMLPALPRETSLSRHHRAVATVHPRVGLPQGLLTLFPEFEPLEIAGKDSCRRMESFGPRLDGDSRQVLSQGLHVSEPE